MNINFLNDELDTIKSVAKHYIINLMNMNITT